MVEILAVIAFAVAVLWLAEKVFIFFTMKPPKEVDEDMVRLMRSINEAEYNWRWRAYMEAPTQQTLEAAWKADRERTTK